MNAAFWRGRRVLVTGVTGFKGSWLALWLKSRGADICGFALPPPTEPSLFDTAQLGSLVAWTEGDVRSLDAVRAVLRERRPEVIFHLAAQPLVRASYDRPVETFATNVLGTVNVLEAVRASPSTRVVVVVTSDKCYADQPSPTGYREDDRLGGHDPYATSKACAELVAASYQRAIFGDRGPAIVTVRAGNVIGGGDWACDRLVPDVVRSLAAQQAVVVRNPMAVRPWQHVLDPLAGYALVAEKAWGAHAAFASAWNFGPSSESMQPVGAVVGDLCRLWGEGASWVQDVRTQPHEAEILRLDSQKSRTELGWTPRLDYGRALSWTADWYRNVLDGGNARVRTHRQIEEYEEMAA